MIHYDTKKIHNITQQNTLTCIFWAVPGNVQLRMASGRARAADGWRGPDNAPVTKVRKLKYQTRYHQIYMVCIWLVIIWIIYGNI